MNNKQMLELFDKLTKFTYIYGLEDELIDIINSYLQTPLSKDEYGNYFIKVGESKTLFTSHLDTVGVQKLKINKIYFKSEGKNFVRTDGNTILGADDKAGVVIMINMINKNVPGTYYFFIGEEVGHVGAGLIYTEKSEEMLSKFDRCVEFDRRGYGSIISRQVGQVCCSDEFVDELAIEFKEHGMEFKNDLTGYSTDSADFMGTIPECTNLSVGYFNEHSKWEEQDLDYMTLLADTCTKIDWENLPTVRIPKSFDSKNPENIKEKPEHLPQYKLLSIFREISNVISDVTDQYCSNKNFFKPEKEMLFFSLSDHDAIDNFSLILHLDGSITIQREDVITEIPNIEIFRILDNEYALDYVLFLEKGYDFNVNTVEDVMDDIELNEFEEEELDDSNKDKPDEIVKEIKSFKNF